ncbi:MAG: leucine-rich repeat protein, partial [Clostridia bacterium]|nr:leucine-rich repeat protein [Clostridia bacterium]
IDIPNTKNNAKLFDHIYKVEAFGGSIEMLKKYECVLQVNDVTVFEGYFQLKKVTRDDLKRVIYKGIVYSNVKDFVETLGNSTLRGNTNAADDLDFSEYAETAANMNLAKFKTKLNSYGTGKTGYGLTLIDKTNKAGVSFANNAQSWFADELTPYLFVKEIWDKIFAQAGYSYESNFLTGQSAPVGYPDFTSLIYPYPNNNKKLGDADNWQKITAGGAFNWTSGYYDMFLPSQWVFANSGNYIDYPSSFTLTNHNMPDDRTHWQFTAPYTSSYHVKFKIPISLKCELHPYDHSSEQWLPQYTGAVTCGDTTKEFIMWTRLGKIHGSTTTYITSWGNSKNFESTYNTGADGKLLLDTQEVSYEGDIRLEAGDKLFLTTAIQMEVAYYDQTFEKWYSYLMYRGTGGWVSVFPYPASVEMTQTVGVEIFSATQNDYFGEGLPFNPTHILNPKTKKWDFVNSIIKMFNLYIEDIGDRKFRIEPRDLYYDTGVKKNFTDKVDTSSMSFTRVDTYIYSDVNFKFAQDKDTMTEAYNQTYQLPYGEYVLEGALSSGQDSVEIKPVFGTSMCGVVNAQTSVLQCPKMYAFKANSDVVNVDKVYSDRIFYIWQNAMANHAGTNNAVLIKSRYSSSTQTQSTYYCADILNAGYGSDTQALSWWNNEEYLENLGDGTVSNGNLYNRFYSKMLSELNDPEARILSCKMHLKAEDIRNLRLSDTITVANVDYRVNSIRQWEDYSAPTEVELIKIVRPSYGYAPSRQNAILTAILEANAELNIMKGATEVEDGMAGWVPTPEAGDENKFLRGDGTWQTVGGGGEYTGVAPIEVSGAEISLNLGAGLEVSDHDALEVNTDHTTIGINDSGQIYAKIPDIKVKHIYYEDDVFDSKDFNYLDIDGNKDMTIIVRDYSTQDSLYTYRYFRLDTSNPQEENLYIFESDKEYLTYRNDNTWSISRKPFDVQRIRVGNVYVSPNDGVITLAAGSNVSLSSSGSTITISSTGGGGGGGIDNITVGGTTVSPTSGSVSLTAGNNVTLTPSGSDITITADAGVENITVGGTTVSPTSGAVELAAGSNVTLTASGSQITIASDAGVTKMQIGSTDISPLNGAIKLVAGSNVTLTASGNEIAIASTGGGSSNDAVIRYNAATVVTGDWVTNNTDTSRNTYDSQTGDGVLYLNAGVTTIGGGSGTAYTPFYYKSDLVSVDLTDSGITIISSGAFAFCSALATVTLTGNATYIGNSAFQSCTSLTSISIPSGVTSIGNYAFAYCSALASVTLSEALTTIGSGAFEYCTSLTSITITLNVTHIGDSAFVRCENLATVNIYGYVTHIGDSAFAYCTSLTSISIPGSTEKIGKNAFANCSALATVTLSNGVTALSDNAFYLCTALTSISIPSSVTEIGGYAFYGCNHLTSATIRAGLLRNYAFGNCSALASVTLTQEVAHIGQNAFSGISSTATITCQSKIPPLLAGNVFRSVTSFARPTSGNQTLKVPSMSVNLYKNFINSSTYGYQTSGWSLEFPTAKIVSA